MKKTVNIDKTLSFNSVIGEISAINIEHDLKFIDEVNIEGNILVSGKYRLTKTSRVDEDFKYAIPTEISLSKKIDLNTTNIEIIDFSYELENDKDLNCHIELAIEGNDLEVLEDNRECDSDIEKELEIPTKEEILEEEKSAYSVFNNIKEENETYGTFVVYIMRDNESINSIIEKYNTTIEEIEKYNDIKKIENIRKVIIPLHND